jgi:hypothetical protein
MIGNDGDVTTLFIEFSRRKLLEHYWPRLRASVEPLTEEQVWWRPNEQSNSIGNLVLHLNGNVRQWLVDSFEGRDDKRDRPAEFAAQDGMTAAALLERLGATMGEAARVFDKLTEKDLVAYSGLSRERAGSGLPGGGALRSALWANRVYIEEPERARPGVL